MRGPLLSKQAIERRTFEALAPLIGWQIVPDSIKQPSPPQPDVLCEVVGHGPLAVELVALDASDTRRRLTNMFTTRAAWEDAISRWPASVRQELQIELRNAYISLNFANEAGSRDRAALLRTVQEFLLGHAGFSGEIDPEDIGAPQGFHGAKVGRFDVSDGPHISAPSGAYWQPPQVDKITEKLPDKTYEPVAPLELFAYATHDEPDGAVGSLETIEATVAEHLPASMFQRVHLFHLGFLRHICSIP